MAATPSSSSLTETAYWQLRTRLLACRIPPGERIRINVLAAELDVSLGAIREALARLTSDGLVIAEPQRGFRAAPISTEELLDLTSTRVEIEALCLRRAIEQGDLVWESRMVSAYHTLSRTGMHVGAQQQLSDAWYGAHGGFHEALVSGCNSPTLLQIRRQLFVQTERYRRLSVPLAEADRDLDREHKQMLDAVLARDAATAIQLMRCHLEETTRILLHAVRQQIGAVAATPA